MYLNQAQSIKNKKSVYEYIKSDLKSIYKAIKSLNMNVVLTIMQGKRKLCECHTRFFIKWKELTSF